MSYTTRRSLALALVALLTALLVVAVCALAGGVV